MWSVVDEMRLGVCPLIGLVADLVGSVEVESHATLGNVLRAS